MKTTRAYIASIGTTGVLIASAVVLLLVGSALVAFNGWPGGGGNGERDSVVVEDGSIVLEGPEQVAADAAPAAAAVAAVPAPGTPAAVAAAQGVPVAESGAPAVPGGPGPENRIAPREDAGGTRPAVPPPVAGAPGGGPVSAPTPGAVEQTTRELTRRAGETAGQVDPRLAEGITRTGEAVEGLVDGVTGGLNLP